MGVVKGSEWNEDGAVGERNGNWHGSYEDRTPQNVTEKEGPSDGVKDIQGRVYGGKVTPEETDVITQWEGTRRER